MTSPLSIAKVEALIAAVEAGTRVVTAGELLSIARRLRVEAGGSSLASDLCADLDTEDMQRAAKREGRRSRKLIRLAEWCEARTRRPVPDADYYRPAAERA